MFQQPNLNTWICSSFICHDISDDNIVCENIDDDNVAATITIICYDGSLYC